MAGRDADGLVLAEGTGPAAVRAALRQADPAGEFHVAVFARLCVAPQRATAYRAMAPFLAGLLDHAARAFAHCPSMTTWSPATPPAAPAPWPPFPPTGGARSDRSAPWTSPAATSTPSPRLAPTASPWFPNPTWRPPGRSSATSAR